MISLGHSLVAALKSRMGDPLRRSADALIIGTGLTSLLGLAFWALAARWLPTEAVGVGAALMSTVALLANFATLGMRNGLLRFLPAAGSGTLRLIFTCYALCAGSAMLAAGIFLAGQPLWAAKLGFLRDSPLTALAFVAGTAVWVIFVLQDQVLIGLRHTGWVPLQNVVTSLLKIAALPLAASAMLWAVFAATIVPALLAVAFIGFLVVRFGRRIAASDTLSTTETRTPVSSMVRFAASDHVATLLWFATADVLTLMVLHLSGAEASAYWYMANTIGYSLYLVTSNVGSALIAESVHDPENATMHARRALLHSSQLVVPAAIIGIFVAPWALRLMGPDYSENATLTLQLILASAIPQLIVGISLSTARVRGNMGTVVGVYVFSAATMWGGSWFALQAWGITGIGVVILLNQILVAAYLLATGRTGLWDNARGWRSLPARVGELPRNLRRWKNKRRAGKLLGPVLESCGLSNASPARVLTSDSDALVVELGGLAEPLIAKIAISQAASRGLDRHADALEGLAAITGPGLSALLPKVVYRSSLDGNRILIESKLPGRPLQKPAVDADACRAALAAMAGIHAETNRLQEVDEALIAQWIDEPIAVLRPVYTLPGTATRLDGLSKEMHRAWGGEHLITGFVHGDFWTGNVLVQQNREQPVVSGIVDWENASRVGLPDTDMVHWWLTSQPVQLGEAVRSAMENPGSVRKGLADFGVLLPNKNLHIEHLVLHAWLTHVAAGLARASTNQVGLVWLARNVAPVMRLFDPDGIKDSRRITR